MDESGRLFLHSNEEDFEVLAESDDYIAVSKPAPLIVHPTDNKGQATLLCGLQQLLCYELENGAALSIINRLDRETSGVVLVAKNKSTARAFSRAMERREVEKSYMAVLCGNPEWSEVTVDEPIGNQRDYMTSRIWLKQMVHEDGKRSVTTFSKIKDYKGYSLVKVTPLTGRMHQIRVHASHLGFPLLGDKIYGPDENCYLEHIERGWTERLQEVLLFRRHALHV